MEIPVLNANDIECRVQSCGKTTNGKGGWCSLLLYKDARVDQRMLDKLFGQFGWQRRHEAVNGQVCCIVKVKDPNTGEWIEKEDVGTESNTEAVKGQFSDSFKRACFNLGIGRELYTAPSIFINLAENEMKIATNGRVQVSSKVCFVVKEIGYDKERCINKLVIIDNNGIVRYEMGKKSQPAPSQAANAPAPAANPATTPASEEDIEIQLNGYALPAIKQAQEERELIRIWNDFKILQADQRFISALNARKKEIDTPIK